LAMSEERADQAKVEEGIEATADPLASAPASVQHQTFVCESCGPNKPVEQVYQCTLCTMSYCVRHLAPMAHYCFGALGKSQSIGVSS